MSDFDSGLDKQKLEGALRNALRSVLGRSGPGVDRNPRTEFYNMFQREMDEHDRGFEKQYDEDLNTTLIFSGLFSAVTTAFIIDAQSELKPNYEEMNNRLLEMLLNATTGSLHADFATSVPRWSGPDHVIVQVQCILYLTLCATLLASLLAMFGKQWLSSYRWDKNYGPIDERSKMRERKLGEIEKRHFHHIMAMLPVILQGALFLLGIALSRYLWKLSRAVSSITIGFASFGFILYLAVETWSISSPDCPFGSPYSPIFRLVIRPAVPFWRILRRTLGPKRKFLRSGLLGPRRDSPVSLNTVGENVLEASIATLACMAPTTIQFPFSVPPLFGWGHRPRGDSLDARCINRMFVIYTGADVIIPTMDFIPEIVWNEGIKNVPTGKISSTLQGCFDFSGPSPVVIPKLRDMAYLSARAYTHIKLQRRCIAEHKQDHLPDRPRKNPILSHTCYGSDSDLGTVLFAFDMTLGYDGRFSWERVRMTPPHHAWMSHVFLYRAWAEGQVSEVVMDFVESSMSLRPPSDIVITDCLFIIGFMLGISLHVDDILVRNKSREKNSILGGVFRVLSAVFSSKSMQTPSALRALRLVTRLAVADISNASYELFKTVMAGDGLTDWHWEAARLAIRGAFQENVEMTPPTLREPKELLKFLDYHLGLQGAGDDHEASIVFALEAIVVRSDDHSADLQTIECIRDVIHANSSFVGGVRSIVQPDRPFKLRSAGAGFISFISDQWFNSPVPVMEPEEMSEFCEHLAAFIVDEGSHQGAARTHGVPILFEMLRSPEWRNHIVTRFWSTLAYCASVEEERESFRWCLGNAMELLEFTRGLDYGEGLKWWYGALWLHLDKLDGTVRDEVERIAIDMSSGDGISDLNFYLDLIGQEAARLQQEVDGLHDESGPAGFGTTLRAQLIALEGNGNRLASITGRG